MSPERRRTPTRKYFGRLGLIAAMAAVSFQGDGSALGYVLQSTVLLAGSGLFIWLGI